ncbi:MAG: glycine cleavage system aminomethyltransferase GcvT [Gammaproteobacteria bacterium]|nr:MAG: glycine cleavage system aminomethyltransferase GcvT [Gammaproteobacteria bacterium]
MSRQTPLHEAHRRAGARMVDFAGWSMPLHYGSQIAEHHAVRRAAGVFDVSHMTIVDVEGPQATPFLRRLLANDVARLETPGRALYACMLNPEGGVIDDLIVYRRGPEQYRLVVNAATREKDLDWLARQAEGFAVQVRARDDLAMLAVQGPRAREQTLPLLPAPLREAAAALAPFQATVLEHPWMAARTGYTGEDGFEILLPAEAAEGLWEALLGAGVVPAGLGARDTLRLEAGMNLYGADMTEETTPLESGLGWTVAWEPAERDFVGRAALEAQRAQGVPRLQVGLVLEDRGVLRPHQRVLTSAGTGEVTSGTHAPTVGRSIALARVPAAGAQDPEVRVEVRGRPLRARVVRPPFVRHGRVRV